MRRNARVMYVGPEQAVEGLDTRLEYGLKGVILNTTGLSDFVTVIFENQAYPIILGTSDVREIKETA